jgi:hypothetical protein
MSQDWNLPANPWQSTDLPWKDVNMPWNSTDLPWKAGGGADTVDNLLAADVSSTSSVSAPALVDVPPASNLLTQPKAFDHADWTKIQCSITADAATDPDSTTLADTITEASDTNQFHGFVQNVTKAASAIAYTLKIYAKIHPTDSRNRLAIQLDDNAGNGRKAIVDVANGEELGVAVAGYGAGFSGGTVTVGAPSNGWVLCTLAGVTTNSATTVRAIFGLDALTGTDADGTTYSGNGTSSMYLYNAVLTAD